MTLTALFISCSVIMGFILAPIPNLELMTATIFLSGIILGKKAGLTTGLLTAFIWSVLNPWCSGFAYPFLLVAQCFSLSIIGAAGGIIRKVADPAKICFRTIVIFGLSGFLLTLLYELLTNLSIITIAGFSFSMIKTYFLAGIPFAALHVISNSVIYGGVLPTVLNRLTKRGLLKGLFFQSD